MNFATSFAPLVPRTRQPLPPSSRGVRRRLRSRSPISSRTRSLTPRLAGTPGTPRCPQRRETLPSPVGRYPPPTRSRPSTFALRATGSRRCRQRRAHSAGPRRTNRAGRRRQRLHRRPLSGGRSGCPPQRIAVATAATARTIPRPRRRHRGRCRRLLFRPARRRPRCRPSSGLGRRRCPPSTPASASAPLRSRRSAASCTPSHCTATGRWWATRHDGDAPSRRMLRTPCLAGLTLQSFQTHSIHSGSHHIPLGRAYMMLHVVASHHRERARPTPHVTRRVPRPRGRARARVPRPPPPYKTGTCVCFERG